MFPLFESIKVLNGKIFHLEWHRWRFERSYKYFFGKSAPFKIEEVISLPDESIVGLHKLRFSYGINAYRIDYEPYVYKKINSLKLLHHNSINYSLKYTDRSDLDFLLTKKGNCDDILIVKNQLVTDSSLANIVFFDGKKWTTPKSALLKGTSRERLISNKIIHEEEIELNDLKNYKCFKLINAMRDFNEVESLAIDSII